MLKFTLKWLIRLMLLGIMLLTIILIAGNAYIDNQASKLTPDPQADSVIILGAHIEGHPLRPSLMLQYRLDKAIEYWEQNPNITMITTGGRTVGYPQSEAEVMQQYLVRKGIPESQILLEEDSTRTAHQFINAKVISDNAGKPMENTVIITNDFHLPRAMILAKRSGLETVSGFASETPRDNGSKITAYIREPLALLNSFLFDWP